MYSQSAENSSHFFGIMDRLYLTDIHAPSNPLRNITSLEIKEIADSIIQHGLLNAIIVRPMADNYFEIVSGYRRYLACKVLGWKKIQCQIVHLNEIQTFEVSLIENINRKSLSSLEEAKAFKIYTETNGWGSIADLAKKIAKSPSYVTKRVSLLTLPEQVQEKIHSGELKPSLAEELLTIKNSIKQSNLCDAITDKNLTTSRIRNMIRDDPYYCENSEIIDVRRELQSFNKTIIALRIAMNRIGEIAEEENNFLIKELILHNIKAINSQIDMLLQQKKKYAKKVFRYRKLLSS